MLVITIRVVLALILTAAIPYALTVAAVAVMWLDETFHAIFGKNHVTGRSRAARFAVSAIVSRNSVETSGPTGIRRGFLEMKRLKMFDTSVSKSASWQELPVETGRERLTNLVGAPTIMRRGRELNMSEDGAQGRATTAETAQRPLRIKTDILGRPSPNSDSCRSPQPDVIEKVRCVESIHHWHR